MTSRSIDIPKISISIGKSHVKTCIQGKMMK
jgi:hypothetical protein